MAGGSTFLRWLLGAKARARSLFTRQTLRPLFSVEKRQDLRDLADLLETGRLTPVIDRTYSYLRPGYIGLSHPSRLPKRKQLVFILTQGHRDPDWFAHQVFLFEDWPSGLYFVKCVVDSQVTIKKLVKN